MFLTACRSPGTAGLGQLAGSRSESNASPALICAQPVADLAIHARIAGNVVMRKPANFARDGGGVPVVPFVIFAWIFARVAVRALAIYDAVAQKAADDTLGIFTQRSNNQTVPRFF